MIFVIITQLNIFIFVPTIDDKEIRLFASYALKKFYIIYVKNVFNLLYWKSIVFALLTIICQIFWESKLYVYAEGQFYWNLDSILSVRIYRYDIWTFVIVTILLTRFRISIYIENRHCLHFPNVGHFEDFCFRELL